MDLRDEWRERVAEALYCSRDVNLPYDDPLDVSCVDVADALLAPGGAVADIAAAAWDQGRRAERRDWEFTFDLSTPDEDRQPWPNPYREGDE